MVVKKRGFRKYIVLPTCLLMLNVIEEVLVYKTELIDNDYIRTGVLLSLFLFGFSMVSFVVSPLAENWLQRAYFAGRRIAGIFGILCIITGILIGVYFSYYTIYTHGPKSLLPTVLHNPVKP